MALPCHHNILTLQAGKRLLIGDELGHFLEERRSIFGEVTQVCLIVIAPSGVQDFWSNQTQRAGVLNGQYTDLTTFNLTVDKDLICRPTLARLCFIVRRMLVVRGRQPKGWGRGVDHCCLSMEIRGCESRSCRDPRCPRTYFSIDIRIVSDYRIQRAVDIGCRRGLEWSPTR